ncbi:hypothetical protein QE152_g6943 [Popillia japonica]|uniref:Uncharacterized protein n=1 Tax=Popillia japonica TaxID=7064 RepID=A0AAW1MG66_POPJA
MVGVPTRRVKEEDNTLTDAKEDETLKKLKKRRGGRHQHRPGERSPRQMRIRCNHQDAHQITPQYGVNPGYLEIGIHDERPYFNSSIPRIQSDPWKRVQQYHQLSLELHIATSNDQRQQAVHVM